MKRKTLSDGPARSAVPEYRIFSDADFAAAGDHILKYAKTVRRGGRGSNDLYNDLIIAADTETSKTRPDVYDEKGNYVPGENIVVAWTISVRNAEGNICTIYGAKPSHFAAVMYYLQEILQGDKTVCYFHNLSYDWPFLQCFLIELFGKPVHQLNTKPHYPISVEFEDGLILRDSLIIAQVRLEKWADDLDVEHKKAVGKWDYSKRRDQSGEFTEDEVEYIEHDTLALVECLEKLRKQLRRHVYSMPMTCTSIVRSVTREEGRRHRARNRFERMAPDFRLYTKLVQCYHGGFTHNNRFAAGWIWPDPEHENDLPTCYDFASSYPFRMLVDKFPRERFRLVPDEIDFRTILKHKEDTAFCFSFMAENIELRDPREPMPALQYSKCVHTVDADLDNGRIIHARFVEIVLTEIDLEMIAKQYKFDRHVCFDVYAASKGPLPRWFRDLVYKCFEEKTTLKGGDPVAYALAKAKLNSLYGMCCQRSIKPEIVEDYETGDFTVNEQNTEELYQKYLENYNSILPYFWGVWVTAYAQKALFELGSCLSDNGIWLYSDTDSVYALSWDQDKLEEFNDERRRRLKEAGYGPVMKDGREYWPGVAELDGVYQEFIGLHSKCYAVRYRPQDYPKNKDGTLKLGKDGKPFDIKITVAGVPKAGGSALNHDLSTFRDGFIFPGSVTGKLTHFYLYRNGTYTDENGIEYGNSVDLHECDYKIGMPKITDFFEVFGIDDVEVQTYDNE